MLILMCDHDLFLELFINQSCDRGGSWPWLYGQPFSHWVEHAINQHNYKIMCTVSIQPHLC